MTKQISLKDYLKETGIKKYKIADMLSVRPATVGSWAEGKTNPNIDMLRAIEDITGGKVGLYSPWGNEVKGIGNE